MPRREFAAEVKRQAIKRAGFVCEGVNEAGIRCRIEIGRGQPVEYDHVITDWMGGEPTLENCQALCRVCHKIKTALDAAERAQARRREDRHNGIRPRARLVSRGLPGKADKPSTCRTPDKLAGLPRRYPDGAR